MTESSSTRRVMGTTASVIVHGADASASRCFDRLDELEARWSRFLPDSELSRLNRAAGHLTVVSPDLFRLVDHLVAAHRWTEGRFDPTLHDQLVAWGYDRTYRELADDPSQEVIASIPEHEDRCAEITLIPTASTVLLPAGTHLDPGGLGKGLAGDIVAAEAIAAGADGVLVEIGGDVVTRGTAPDGGAWRIAVPANESSDEQIIELHDGAVATSDTAVRQWSRGGSRHQHVLDPLTAAPLTERITATVIAGAGWWAEAVATAAVISQSRRDGWLDAATAERLGTIAFVTEHERVDV